MARHASACLTTTTLGHCRNIVESLANRHKQFNMCARTFALARAQNVCAFDAQRMRVVPAVTPLVVNA